MIRRRTPTVLAAGLCALVATLVTGCAWDGSANSVADLPTGAVVAERLHPEILRELPHDPTAFTQGLELVDGTLYESTGLVGRSWVRATDFATGEQLAHADLAAPLFGEGIAVTEDTLWQVTWKDGVAIARDPSTLAQQRQVEYDGEGWGLCLQPGRLVMSDGSSTLTFRDPVTFAPTGTVDVTLDGRALDQLNELECADDGLVYANVWTTDQIVRIDPESGVVRGRIDAAGLREALPAEERDNVDVLNGIAQIPGTDRFLVTGKLWPRMFEVRFVS